MVAALARGIMDAGCDVVKVKITLQGRMSK
jgi:hypothetical protein